MVRRAAICQKLEPMPRLILRILNRAGIAPWFRDFEAVVIGMNQYGNVLIPYQPVTKENFKSFMK